MMKYGVALMLYLMANLAQAAIYVCEDANHQKTYQDEPCTSRTIGQLEHVPDASIEDQARVQNSIRTANENYIKRMQLQKAEQAEQMEMERQRLALEVERRKLQQLSQQEDEANQPIVVINRWPGRFDRGYRNPTNAANPYRNFKRYDGVRNQPGRSGISIQYSR